MVMLMPVKDGLTSRARLVDRECYSFQMLSMQVWRIPRERISINMSGERLEEAVGVYAKDTCSIPAGMGKYIPVLMNPWF